MRLRYYWFNGPYASVSRPGRTTTIICGSQGNPLIMKRNLIFLSLLGLAGCMQQAGDQESYLPRYTGSAPWTINGARPGMTLDEVRQKRGEPTRFFGTPPTSYSWESTSWRTLSVTVDANGRIVQVSGNALMAGDQTILSGSVSDADVKAVLGAGDVTSSTQPGSFVIPTSGKVVGTHHRYRNGNVTFAFSLTKEQGLRSITAD
jgi:hypothetical protein